MLVDKKNVEKIGTLDDLDNWMEELREIFKFIYRYGDQPNYD